MSRFSSKTGNRVLPSAADESGSPPHAGVDLELARAADVAGGVPDPEIPVITLADLGVFRGVRREAGRITVTLTPTYTGCPATALIRLEVEKALAEAGFADARVETVLAPAWSTDEITEVGRRKLREYGIAPPPVGAGKGSLLFGSEEVVCPQCGSTRTVRLSEFGSTPCKALWRCEACLEPFDAFKCL